VRGQLAQVLSAVHRLECCSSMTDVEESHKLLARALRALADILDIAKLGEGPTKVLVGRIWIQIVYDNHAKVLL